MKFRIGDVIEYSGWLWTVIKGPDTDGYCVIKPHNDILRQLLMVHCDDLDWPASEQESFI